MTTTGVDCGLLIADPHRDPIADARVVIDGTSFVYAGSIADAPPVERVIDCGGLTVVPGLVDTHTHITAELASGLTLEEMLGADPTTAALRGHANLMADLRSGVTTMRTLGDPEGVDIAFKHAIDDGLVEGPRLQVCIRALRPSHGTARFLAHVADGPEELRRMVRRNFEAGADVIKLFITNVMHGRTYEDYLRGDLTDVAAYTREEIDAALDEARTLGVPVAAHAIGGDAMRWAIDDGIASIEHANLMEPGDPALMARQGTFLSDPNLQLFFDAETGFRSFDTWRLPWWREKVELAAERTRLHLPRAVAEGVKVCLAGDSLHGVLWREAVHLADLGVPAPAVLAAVTVNGAELLGMSDRIGTVAAGKAADLVAVSGNPLEDARALGRVQLVMKDGRVVDSA